MVAQYFDQCCLKEVDRRVVGSYHLTICRVDLQFEFITDMDASFTYLDMMQILTIRCFLDIEDFSLAVIIVNDAFIGDLAAGFGIEAGVVKGDFTLFTDFIDLAAGDE